jgi:hypothetical protein
MTMIIHDAEVPQFELEVFDCFCFFNHVKKEAFHTIR